MPLEPFREIEYPSLRDLSHQFPSVDWLWPSWIPRGMLTLFGAAPGVGKSLVALDLARRVIHNRPFPDGGPVRQLGGNSVIIVDAEGAPALLNQRAQAWHIDSSRLYLMQPPDGSGFIDLAQPRQFERFTRMVDNIRPALVVVDSLAAATSSGETSLQGARDILGSLASLADMFDVALLVIHHLRKRARSGAAATSPKVVADDLRGSSHISAAARSVLALSLSRVHPEHAQRNEGPVEGPREGPAEGSPNPQSPVSTIQAPVSNPQSPVSIIQSPVSNLQSPSPLRRLEVVKTNLCRHPPPLALRFEGEGVAVPTLHYSEWVEPPPPPTQRDLCAQWLLQFLAAAGEPVRPRDVIQAAIDEGFPRPTLYRARKLLKGTVVDLGNSPYDPNKRWTIASPSQNQGSHD